MDGQVALLVVPLETAGRQRAGATEASYHHKVSVAFLCEGSALRRAIDEMPQYGMSARLFSAVRALGAVPLDDAVAEGPHARAHRLELHSRRACWPWHDSSLRLA